MESQQSCRVAFSKMDISKAPKSVAIKIEHVMPPLADGTLGVKFKVPDTKREMLNKRV